MSSQFQRFLRKLKIEQVRTAFRHPETNGRYHLTLKDATVRLETHKSPAAARAAIERFVYEHNTQRPLRALDNATLASVHFDYANELRILRQRRRAQARANRISVDRRQTA